MATATASPPKKAAPAKRSAPKKAAPKPRSVKAAPTVPTPVEVRAAALERALSNALVFAGRDDTIPVISSVFLKVSGKTLTVYATDRYTMIREHVQLEERCRAATLLVDRRSVELLAAALRRYLRSFDHRTRGDASVTITVTGRAPAQDTLESCGQLDVTVGLTSIEVHGEAGVYPDCDKLIDKRKKGDAPAPFATAINPAYLARIAKVRTGASRYATAWLFSQDFPTHPVRAVPQDEDVDDPRVIVITMPVRRASIGDAEKVEKW